MKARRISNAGNGPKGKGRDRAIVTYREAVRLDPNDIEGRLRLAQALRARGELHRAIAEYREVIRLRPSDPFAHRKLGELLGDIADFDNAIAAYRQALHLKPKDYETHYSLGYLLGHLGRWEEAAGHLLEFCRTAPKSRAYQDRATRVQEELDDLRFDRKDKI